MVAVVCLLTVTAVVSPVAGLALALAVLAPYVVLSGMRRERMERPGSRPGGRAG